MLRNKQEQKEKYLISLDREQRRLFKSDWNSCYRDTLYDWVPVEKPRFLGYDVILVWSEVSYGRSDIGVLNEILSLSSSVYCKNGAVKDLVSKARGRYKAYNELLDKFVNDLHKFNEYSAKQEIKRKMLPDIQTGISEQKYDGLSDKAKKYFHKVVETKFLWNGSSYEVITYRVIREKLPLYELEVKLKPVYSTHRGIPKSTVWRRDKEIDDILYSENYWNKQRGRYDSYYRYEQKQKDRQERYRYKRTLSKINDVDDIYDLNL